MRRARPHPSRTARATDPQRVDASLAHVLAQYPGFSDPRASTVEQGWIHHTWRIDEGERSWVLQELNPLFSLGVQENIDVVTARLVERGVETSRLVRTRQGALVAELSGDASRRFRLMTWVEGTAFDGCASQRHAASAGRLAARFHSALDALEHDFAPLGFPFHEPAVHLADLDLALRDCRGHRLHPEIVGVASEIAEISDAWEPLGPVPDRVVHLDLKFNNILFRGAEGAEEACCLIDLDTLSRRPMWIELGDAWRSWCNRMPEHEARAEYAPEIFEASAGAWLETVAFDPGRSERISLAHAIERLSVELAARFAADALRESYFGWNSRIFASAGEHNLSRARGQLSLHAQARESRDDRLRFLLG